jgi:two-component system cell cycle sensor histidine kinase/response regulator CckA
MTDRQTVLVVDDEEVLRRAARRILERAGYDVAEAPGGTEALEIIRANGRQYIAVMLDVRMPGMSGPETFAALRESYPELPVVFVTAQQSRELAQELDQPLVGYVAKPYDRGDLVDALHRLGV